MRILITGGAGFIGSHLCQRFLGEGHQVVVMDNLLTGRADNIAAHMGNPSFQFIHYDVTEYIHIEGPLDFILHFASPASPADFERLGIKILKVGALGTHKTLGLACAKGAKFLLASTSEVYGDPQVHPQSEEYWGNVNPIGIRGVYDEAKRFAESMTMAYNRLHGVDTRIVRIFNTYGPRMRGDDGRAIPNFITQALAGEDVTVYGDGLQTRSIGFVTDLVEGIRRLMDSRETTPVNIGNPTELTMKALAEKIIDLTGSNSRLVHQALPDDDPKFRLPDITKARSLLGWEPEVGPDEGLRRTVDWFRQEAPRRNATAAAGTPDLEDDRVQREASFHDAVFASGARHGAGKFYLAARAAKTYYRERIGPGRQGLTVLEYGCGRGSAAFELAREGATVTGIDISDVGIREAQAQAEALQLGERASFVRMNAEDLDLPDHSFDLVCGSGILHHLDIERAGDEIVRVLRPGGAAVFFEPLGHNPAINLYRRLTPTMRSADEHPLRLSDLQRLAARFESAEHRFFSLLTLAAVPLRSARLLDALAALDRWILRVPWVRRFAWIVVTELRAPA